MWAELLLIATALLTVVTSDDVASSVLKTRAFVSRQRSRVHKYLVEEDEAFKQRAAKWAAHSQPPPPPPPPPSSESRQQPPSPPSPQEPPRRELSALAARPLSRLEWRSRPVRSLPGAAARVARRLLR
jgi:hypothetical protein